MWSLPRTAILFFGAWANSNPEMLSDLRFPEGSSCTALGSPILSAPTRPGFGILSRSVANARHLLSLLLRWSCSQTICYPCPQNRH
jgi:hypothetical protein